MERLGNVPLDDPLLSLPGDLLGDPRDSAGFAGWLDSYMDEVMTTNNIPPQAPTSFHTNGLDPVGGVPFNLDFLPRPVIVTGKPKGLLGGDPAAAEYSGRGVPLEFGERSGSSNSGESQQENANTQGVLASSKAAAKALAVAEKNRKAQKRFRERQKSKMLDSQKQVEELSTKLAAVMHEKNKLESRNNVLEKVVKLKEEQISAMQSRGIGTEPMKVGPDGKPIAQDELYEVLWNFCRVVQRGEIQRSLDDKQAIPLAAMQQKHKEWVEEVATALMNGADDPATPAHARMNELIAIMRETTTRLGLLNDRLMMTMCATTIVPDPAAQPPDLEYWRKVLESTNLSQQQKLKVREVHHELMIRMEAVLKEREGILQHLQERRGSGDLKELSSIDQAGGFLAKHSGLDALQKNLKEEYEAAFNFELAFYHTILLPLQQAKMAVQAYPWCSDTLALCQLIVEEIGEYPVEEGHLAPPSHQSLLSKVTANSPFLSLTGMRATPA